MPPQGPPIRRVAALFDIHGNLPALEAVLDEVRGSGAERIVIGGDVIPGPFPRESMERLFQLELPVEFIHGNCERAAMAHLAAPDLDSITYWGSASGKRPPEPVVARMRWSAEQVRDFAPRFEAWPRTRSIEIEGIGRVLFCHSTPRSETEIFTRLTAESKLAPIFDPLGVALVVCGHTHMPFDRRVGGTRVVNPGSVGAPIGSTAAHWAMLGPGVELRRTGYDIAGTAQAIRATSYPTAEDAARELLAPPAEADVLEIYGKAELS